MIIVLAFLTFLISLLGLFGCVTFWVWLFAWANKKQIKFNDKQIEAIAKRLRFANCPFEVKEEEKDDIWAKLPEGVKAFWRLHVREIVEYMKEQG